MHRQIGLAACQFLSEFGSCARGAGYSSMTRCEGRFDNVSFLPEQCAVQRPGNLGQSRFFSPEPACTPESEIERHKVERLLKAMTPAKTQQPQTVQPKVTQAMEY